MTNEAFRSNYAEFSDTNVFADSAINYWLGIADLMVDPTNRMGSDLQGVLKGLFVAHHVVLEAMAQKTVAVGGLPGLSKGAISSESTGIVSLSYDTNSTLELNAGHWNLTLYGSRFIRTARLAGSGPIQVGPNGCVSPLSSAFAWPGIITRQG